ncbi:MAG: gliding motility-associated C-terminal domain-containing protein, partial [Bacteroidia bacterium]|nr:gliding motility-associated C-terminal domain-containing protein [Bacteroidia bacterium]
EKMHFTLIDNKEGVSLERIDFNKPTNDKNNWTSAASTSGFATPTYKNSQYLNFEIKNETLNIEPEVFTPNNDGTNDLVTFTYKFDRNRYTGTLQVFNAAGVLVKTLLNNLPLGAEGSVTWNGLSDANNSLPVGIYVVLFNYFNTDGSSDTLKKTVVIGKTF